MRIAIDARMLGWSGVGRYNYHLLEELQKLDTTNEYLVLLDAQQYKLWQPKKSNFKKVLSPYRPFSANEQFGLAWQLYKLKPDLVHFLNYNSPCLYLKKRVVTIHDLTMVHFKNYQGGPLKRLRTWMKYWPMRFVMRCIVMRSTHIFTPSAYVKKEILRHWGKDVFYERLKRKISVTYEATERLHAHAQVIKPLRGKRFLLFVGNAYPHKNLRNLIDAFEIASVQDHQLKLVLVGRRDPFYIKLQNYVVRNGIKNVVFNHSASDAHLVWLYQNAQMFVFPSLSEGFGLPGLEAMRYKLPVIAADASCLPEVYGDAALYFKANQPTNIAELIMKLLDNKKLQSQLISKGSQRVAEFSWKVMVEQTIKFYK